MPARHRVASLLLASTASLLAACQAPPPSVSYVPVAAQVGQSYALSKLAPTLRGDPGDEAPYEGAIATPSPTVPFLVQASLTPLDAAHQPVYAQATRLAAETGRLSRATARSSSYPAMALSVQTEWTGYGHVVDWRVETQDASGGIQATHGSIPIPSEMEEPASAKPRFIDAGGQQYLLDVTARELYHPKGKPMTMDKRFPAEVSVTPQN